MNDAIRTVNDLENLLGSRPAAVDMKVIDHLDAHARRWLEVSPLAFAGFSDAQHIAATLAGGAPGVAQALDPRRLRLPLAALDDPQQAQPGRGAGLLFLIPGLGETLRVNGTVAAVDEHRLLIDVLECYAHCAKALLRSDFWRPDAAIAPDDAGSFLAATRFMALATVGAGLNTDVSPKGDPAGLLVQRADDEIRFADRPGNRRTDGFRNMLERPQAAAVLIVPGCTRVITVQGQTRLSAAPQLRDAFAVNGKTPKLVTRLTAPAIVLRESGALARAMPWASPEPPADIDPARIFAAHVKLNKTRGLLAALTKGAVSIPGLMRKGLETDYERNLY